MNYYNEFDPNAAAWLNELIYAGEIPVGYVDTRSIEDVTPNDLRGFTQHHFFAGIGGWSRALRLAGWPEDRPIWTGSCPCQPFSSAGKGGGFADERHLWPAWFWLIDQYNPAKILGEQVAKLPGDKWWDVVSSDLETKNYACGSAILGAHSVGAPHTRQRRYWVANANRERYDKLDALLREGEQPGRISESSLEVARSRCIIQLADSSSTRLEIGSEQSPWAEFPTTERGGETSGRSAGFWDACEWLPCRDGKARPIEPGTFPLAHGVPGRVGLLRGYGNAIIPQVAAAFIQAVM